MQRRNETPTEHNDHRLSLKESVIAGMAIATIIAISALLIALLAFPATTIPTILTIGPAFITFLSAEVGLGISLIYLIGLSAVVGGIIGGIVRVFILNADNLTDTPGYLTISASGVGEVEQPDEQIYPSSLFFTTAVAEDPKITKAFEDFKQRLQSFPKVKQEAVINFISSELKRLKECSQNMDADVLIEMQVIYLNQINAEDFRFVETMENKCVVDKAKTCKVQDNAFSTNFKNNYLNGTLAAVL